jgi:hypothetical protein
LTLAFAIPAIPAVTDCVYPWQQTATDPFKSSDVAQKIELVTTQECRSRPEQRDLRDRVFIVTLFKNKYFVSIVARSLVILSRRTP